MAYVSTASLKAWLSVESTANDALMLTCVNAAQAYFDQQTDRQFEASADTTEYLNALADVSSDGLTLYLRRELASATTITNGDGVIVASTEYVTIPAVGSPVYEIRLKASSGKRWTVADDPENAITIVGKWAYGTTAPADVAYAVTVIAAQMYAQKDNPSDADRMISADGVVIVPSSIPKIAADIIRRYRRISF